MLLPRFSLNLLIVLAMTSLTAQAAEPAVLDIGNRLEPFVDGYLIESASNVTHQLHHPVPREIAITFDQPWEGRYCGYVTVIKDGDDYRIYYRGIPEAGHDGNDTEVTCVAESKDGITFTRPILGLYEAKGGKDNNIVLADTAPFSHNFAPFLDTRPGCAPEERYKAIAGTSKGGLYGFISSDGFRWNRLEGPLIEHEGPAFSFDSQNNAFWSELEQCYVCYFRTWRKKPENDSGNGYRWISRRTSPDFRQWGPMEDMSFGDTQPEHLYTNQTVSYARAPHIYIAFAARFMPNRRVVTAAQAKEISSEGKYSGDCSETVFMSSRGGSVYDRTFMEGFIRPGIGPSNWTSRTNYTTRGLVQTTDDVMSMYIQRSYGQPTHRLQRLTLRTDGFASMNAGYHGGEFVTKPLIFKGHCLAINFSTSAAGSVWVELQTADGNAIEGFALDECDEIIGDEIARTVTWSDSADLARLTGKPVKVRFKLKDADVYSLQFR
jgi:hypothetical protein